MPVSQPPAASCQPPATSHGRGEETNTPLPCAQRRRWNISNGRKARAGDSVVGWTDDVVTGTMGDALWCWTRVLRLSDRPWARRSRERGKPATTCCCHLTISTSPMPSMLVKFHPFVPVRIMILQCSTDCTGTPQYLHGLCRYKTV